MLSTKTNNKLKGSLGESIAKKYLLNNKYKVIDTNYTCPIGEIDIVAKIKNTYVFVEVKYRKTTEYGLPREAVTASKQHKIRNVAIYYLKENNLYEKVDVQFDVIDILDDEVTHIKNAF